MPRDRDDDDDEYDDRPRRRRDEDDRPRRVPAKTNTGLIVGLSVGGVVVLLCGGCGVGYFLLARELSKPKPPPVAAAPPPPPAIATPPPAPANPLPANHMATVVMVTRDRATPTTTPPLEVRYVFHKPSGQFDQFDVVLKLEGVLKGDGGTGRVPLTAVAVGESQTIQIVRDLGNHLDLRRAKGEIWIEKRGKPSEPGERVSNVYRLH